MCSSSGLSFIHTYLDCCCFSICLWTVSPVWVCLVKRKGISLGLKKKQILENGVLLPWYLKFLFKVFLFFFSLRRWAWNHHYELSGKLLRRRCFSRTGWKWEPRFVRQAKGDGEGLYMERHFMPTGVIVRVFVRHHPLNSVLEAEGRKRTFAGYRDVYHHPFFLWWVNGCRVGFTCLDIELK